MASTAKWVYPRKPKSHNVVNKRPGPIRHKVMRLVLGSPRNHQVFLALKDAMYASWLGKQSFGDPALVAGQLSFYARVTLVEQLSDAEAAFQWRLVKVNSQMMCDEWLDFAFTMDAATEPALRTKGAFKECEVIVEILVGSDEISDLTDPHVVSSRLVPLAQACILLENLDNPKYSQGIISRPLIYFEESQQKTAGQIRFEYSMISPCAAAVQAFERDAVKAKKALDSSAEDVAAKDFRNPIVTRWIGHRGLGSKGTNPLQENTILSFLSAAMSGGVSHCELDVQLTRDGVPVIYHDFFIKKKDENGNEFRIPVYGLSYKEWKDLLGHGSRYGNTTAMSANGNTDTSTSASKKKHEFYSLDDLSAELGSKAYTDAGTIKAPPVVYDKLPSLLQVLTHLPASIGLNVELKYPAPEFQEEYQLPFPDRDSFLNTVLERVFDPSVDPARSIIFSSFDADVCAWLRMKQDRYPVYFLNSEIRESLNDMKDPRTIDIHNAMEFAKDIDVDGLVLLANMLLENENLAKEIKSKGFKLCTYGKANSRPENVVRQWAIGVDSVIADHVAQLSAKIYAQEGVKYDAETKKLEFYKAAGKNNGAAGANGSSESALETGSASRKAEKNPKGFDSVALDAVALSTTDVEEKRLLVKP